MHTQLQVVQTQQVELQARLQASEARAALHCGARRAGRRCAPTETEERQRLSTLHGRGLHTQAHRILRAFGRVSPSSASSCSRLCCSELCSGLRLALQTDAGMVAVRRKVLRQKVSEASLLLWFAQQSRVEPHLRISSSGGGGNPSPKLTQKYRCGKCDECLVGDCGCCASCLDKPKFGGRGFRKQACLMRRCAFVQKCAQFRKLSVTKS